jgi:hypothetical protein
MKEYKLKLAERIRAGVAKQLELTFKQDPLTDITMHRLHRDISNYMDKCIEEGSIIAQNKMRMTLSELLKQDETYKYLNYFIFVKANNETKEVRASIVELFYNTCTGNIHTVYNDLECLQTRYGTYREVEDELGEERRSQCDDYFVELFVAAHEEGMRRWQQLNTSNT